MKYEARMLDRPATLRTFEAEDHHLASDEYVAQFCKHVPGLAFVEARPVGVDSWALWRVEIIQAGPPLVLFTALVDEAAARAELARAPS